MTVNGVRKFCKHVVVRNSRSFITASLLAILAFSSSFQCLAQGSMPGTYGLKVYNVDTSLYPFVQVFFRTFNEQKQPLVNLNELNIGLMVKGRSYDPMKRQYKVESVRAKQVATRSVLVLDASKSMVGAPFESALRAAARYIDTKRPQDEVAVIAIRDTKEGYFPVSAFERDPAALARRLADVQVDGMQTRLYDSIAAAMQLCGASGQGSMNATIDNFIVHVNGFILFTQPLIGLSREIEGAGFPLQFCFTGK